MAEGENSTPAAEDDLGSTGANEFFYSNERQLRKLDDKFLLSKITEKYPDFTQDKPEALLKQLMVVIAGDSRLFEEIEKKYDVPATEMFKVIYRHYEFLFNKCFVSKMQRIVRSRPYGKKAARRVTSKPKYILFNLPQPESTDEIPADKATSGKRVRKANGGKSNSSGKDGKKSR